MPSRQKNSSCSLMDIILFMLVIDGVFATFAGFLYLPKDRHFAKYEKGIFFPPPNKTYTNIRESTHGYFAEIYAEGFSETAPAEIIPLALRCPKPKGEKEKAQACRDAILAEANVTIRIHNKKESKGGLVAYRSQQIARISGRSTTLFITAGCLIGAGVLRLIFVCCQNCYKSWSARRRRKVRSLRRSQGGVSFV